MLPSTSALREVPPLRLPGWLRMRKRTQLPSVRTLDGRLADAHALSREADRHVAKSQLIRRQNNLAETIIESLGIGHHIERK
jgi:hypothetical protein